MGERCVDCKAHGCGRCGSRRPPAPWSATPPPSRRTRRCSASSKNRRCRYRRILDLLHWTPNISANKLNAIPNAIAPIPIAFTTMATFCSITTQLCGPSQSEKSAARQSHSPSSRITIPAKTHTSAPDSARCKRRSTGIALDIVTNSITNDFGRPNSCRSQGELPSRMRQKKKTARFELGV